MAKNTIESKVADTILQRAKVIEVNGVEYEVAPPSIATLILVSEQISLLPKINVNKETDIITETLRIAKDCSFLGDILAILILGANGIIEKQKVVKKRFFGLVKEETEVEINRQKELSTLLLRDKSPKKLNDLTIRILDGMEIGDFFGLTTYLLEVNLTKPTREVVMTVSGQS